MEKQIGLTEARTRLSEIISDVLRDRDTYVISKQGKPAVAVVPLEVLSYWRAERAKLFQVIEEVQAQNKDADPDELMNVILDAQQAVRAGQSTVSFS